MINKISSGKDLMYLVNRHGVIVLETNPLNSTCKNKGWITLKQFCQAITKYQNAHAKNSKEIEIIPNNLVAKTRISEDKEVFVFEFEPQIWEIQWKGRETNFWELPIPYMYFVLGVKTIELEGVKNYILNQGFVFASENKVQDFNKDMLTWIPFNNIYLSDGKPGEICWGDLGEYNIEKTPSKSAAEFARKAIHVFLKSPFNTELGRLHIPTDEMFLDEHSKNYQWQINHYTKWMQIGLKNNTLIDYYNSTYPLKMTISQMIEKIHV